MGDFILKYDFAESGFISGHIRLSNRIGKINNQIGWTRPKIAIARLVSYYAYR